MAEFAVIPEGCGIEVNGSVLCNIGTALFNKGIDKVDHALYLFCGTGMDSFLDI